MDDLTKIVEGKDRFRLRQGAVSVAAHVLLLLVVAGVFHRTPKIAPYKLPGTAQGVQLLTYYAAGSAEHAVSELALKAAEKPKLETNVRLAQAKSEPEKSAASTKERGAGTAHRVVKAMARSTWRCSHTFRIRSRTCRVFRMGPRAT